MRDNVSACSIAAQGLWFRLMILMHDSERTGYLCLNSLPIPSRIAAIKCAVSVDEYETLLAELMSVAAFSTSKEGIIFSPQLVAEAEERAKNAERQRKFKESKKGNASVTLQVTEKKRNGNAIRADVSSSTSSSSSVGKEEMPPKTETQDDYLIRKQFEFPHLDVQKVFRKYIKDCKNRQIEPKRQFFDTWLENEFEPLTEPTGTTGSDIPTVDEVIKKREKERSGRTFAAEITM